MSLNGVLGFKDTDRGSENFPEWGASLAVTQEFGPFVSWWNNESWNATLFGAYRNTDYDEPDPSIDPHQTQNDDRWDVAFDINVPIYEQLFVQMRFQQTWNTSNLPNEEFNNSAWTAALRYVF